MNRLVSNLLQPKYGAGAVAVVALLALPGVIHPIELLIVMSAIYFALFVVSWDFVSGFTGNLSFGHTAIFASGGYGAALLNSELGLSPPLSILGGVLVALAVGLVFGAPALRLSGPYFSLVTLIIPIVMLRIFVIFSDTFGGSVGLPGPDPLVEGASYFDTIRLNYYVAVVVFVAVVAVLLLISRSDVGKVFTAIREDEEAVSAVGLSTVRFKIYAFAVSAVAGGLAGAVFVFSPVGSPRPSQLLALTINIEIIIAGILGGRGTVAGAASGGFVYFVLEDYVRSMDVTLPVVGIQVSEANLLIFYLVVLVLLYFIRDGLLRWTIRKGGELRAEVSGNSPIPGLRRP